MHPIAPVAPSAMDAQRRALERQRRVWRSHGITGIVLVFGANLLFGLPASLHPLDLLTNAIASALLGFPLGWLTSRSGGGVLRGAAIGAAFLVVSAAMIGLATGGFGASGAITAAILGAFLGAALGWHVEQDA